MVVQIIQPQNKEILSNLQPGDQRFAALSQCGLVVKTVLVIGLGFTADFHRQNGFLPAEQDLQPPHFAAAATYT